jgi:hypothetical protein
MFDRLSDRGQSPRRRVLKTGKIFIDDGRSVVDCTVRSLSATGAMLAVFSASVPPVFDLVLNGISRRCVVM